MPRVTKIDRRLVLIGLAAGAGGIVALHRPLSLPAVAAQARRDLYLCEGCEAVAERDPSALSGTTRIAGPDEPGERMMLTGRVMTADGREPAVGVVIYAHHTNAAGLYANGLPDTQWSRRHGRLRGWVRTDSEGRYSFDTVKPAPYPDRTMPAHVHLFVGEPGKRPYYIDDVVFDGEFGVTPAYRDAQELRGGSGIVRLSRASSGLWSARRDIVLERHPA